MIYKKNLVSFLFPHTTYLSDDSNKYPKHMLLEALMQYFCVMYDFSLTVSYWGKFLWHSNCHYNEFCRYIECRYKEGWLYSGYCTCAIVSCHYLFLISSSFGTSRNPYFVIGIFCITIYYFEHMWNVQIQIILRMCKISSGLFPEY